MTFVGKPSPISSTRRFVHRASVSTGCGVEASDLVRIEIGAHLCRREPGRPEDLVGEGATDSGEQAGIGERPLERMALPGEALSELFDAEVGDLGAAGIEICQAVVVDEMNRGLSLRSGLGEKQRAIREVERCQPGPAWDRCVGSEPRESTGHHEVNHDVEAVVEVEHDPFPEASNTVDTTAATASIGGSYVLSTEKLWIRTR